MIQLVITYIIATCELLWWFIRAGESQDKVPCDSAMDAVYWLSMVDTVLATEALDYEQLLDLPFDQLTSVQWRKLLEYETEVERWVTDRTCSSCNKNLHSS
ncbi:MAG: hypothetical protein RMY28_038130 [Nostoc sp. ChiSLP01]|nr:hypothetical protein [Nostoc sp. CmiSLP01]MDZ8284540.1 hypothetical protein [Nostoc sp. ChiSLP01]